MTELNFLNMMIEIRGNPVKSSLNACPVCGERLVVDRYHCDNCDTTIQGRFENGALPGLSAEQVEFVKTFVRCEGKMTRVGAELGLSYPTIRSRLLEVIRAMGYEPGKDEQALPSTESRRELLDSLSAGRISTEDALRALRGEED